MSIKIGHASIDENGKAKNGTAGDQTGKEVCIRSWYSKPWEFVLRYPDAAIAEKMAAACEAGCANNQRSNRLRPQWVPDKMKWGNWAGWLVAVILAIALAKALGACHAKDVEVEHLQTRLTWCELELEKYCGDFGG